MSAMVSTIEIDRPPAEVYAYVTDPSLFTQWQSDVVSVRLQGPALTVGTRFTTTRRIGPAERSMTQEVTEVVPNRHWAARGVDGVIRPSASITVEPVDGGRSRVTFALDFEGHGAGVALVPIVRAMATRGAPVSYRRLKERLETRAEQ